MYKLLKFLPFLFIFQINILRAQTELLVIEGTVADSITSEPLAGVFITSREFNAGTTTNETGYFKLNLTHGVYKLNLSLIGYKTIVKEIDAQKSLCLKIFMNTEAHKMDEITVTAQGAQNQVRAISTGTFQMTRKELNKLPVLLGETDYFKAIQLMPGIQTTGEGNAAIYVRGGGFDQNLVLLDNATIYNPTHLLGFYSVFNSDIIGGVKVIKSGIPAEYGNRLSSVLEFTTRKDHPEKLTIKGNTGLLSSRLGIEVPIGQKISITLSARKTYLNTLLNGFRKAGWIRHRSVLYKSGYDFYDLNSTANIELNRKNRISLSYYKGQDIFELNSDVIELGTHLTWGSDIFSLTWNKIFNQKFYMENSIITTDYGLNMHLRQNQYDFNLKSSIRDWGFRNKFTWLITRHRITAGMAITYHAIRPNTAQAKSDSLQLNLGTVSKYNSIESGLFLGDEVELTDHLSFYAGLRLNHFIQLGPFNHINRNEIGSISDTISYQSGSKVQTYQGIDFRSSVRYLITGNLSVKASFNTNQQFIHSVNASSITFPTDFWISSSSKVKPQYGMQWASGIFYNLPQKKFEFSLELYYKNLKNQIEFNKGLLNAMDNSAFDENLIFGKGRAYGAEILVRKTQGRISGWIGYTLSKTEKSFGEIENGNWFPAKYDKPIDLSIVLNYTLNSRWEFSALFVYGKGSTYTPVVGRYFIANNIINEYGRYNSARLPDYHRCDLAATLQLKQTKRIDSKLIFSVYNIYNRKNPFFVYPEVKGNLERFVLSIYPKEVSIFPILPSVAWEFNF